MVDFPGADAGEAGGQNISRPFIAKHDRLGGFKTVVFHCLGEFSTHGFLGPPDAVDFDGFTEFLHHFLAAVVADDNNFDTSLPAFFNPILEFVGGFFLGVEPEGIIEIAQQKLDARLFQ